MFTVKDRLVVLIKSHMVAAGKKTQELNGIRGMAALWERKIGREHQALSCLNNAQPDRIPFSIAASCLKQPADSLLMFLYFVCDSLAAAKY